MAQRNKRPSARRWTPTEARSVLAEMASSGMSIHRFARERGIDADRLYRWRRRLRRERSARAESRPAAAPRFAEVTIRPSGPVATVEIDLPGGVAVRVVGETRVEDALAILSRLPAR